MKRHTVYFAAPQKCIAFSSNTKAKKYFEVPNIFWCRPLYVVSNRLPSAVAEAVKERLSVRRPATTRGLHRGLRFATDQRDCSRTLYGSRVASHSVRRQWRVALWERSPRPLTINPQTDTVLVPVAFASLGNPCPPSRLARSTTNSIWLDPWLRRRSCLPAEEEKRSEPLSKRRKSSKKKKVWDQYLNGTRFMKIGGWPRSWFENESLFPTL